MLKMEDLEISCPACHFTSHSVNRYKYKVCSRCRTVFGRPEDVPPPAIKSDKELSVHASRKSLNTHYKPRIEGGVNEKQIIELRLQGKSHDKIVEELRVSKSTVGRVLAKYKDNVPGLHFKAKE